MTFKVRKDLLYRVIFYAAFLLFFYEAYATFVNKHWVAFIVIVLLNLFIGWIWFGSRYIIEGNILIVRSGPFKQTININDITTIRKTKNPFASAALALKRLEINYYHYETIQISPSHTEQFIALLQKIQPGIDVIE